MALSRYGRVVMSAFWETAAGKGFAAGIREAQTAFKTAQTAAMRRAAEAVKLNLRAQLSGAGMGPKLGNTIRSQVYPKNRIAAQPAGAVWSKAPKILAAFRDAPTIRPVKGTMLAIALPQCPKGRRNRPITVPEAIKRFGPPRPVPSAKGVVLLFRTRLLVSGRFGKARKRAGDWTAFYVLVRAVRMPRRIDVDAALAAGAAAYDAAPVAGR